MIMSEDNRRKILCGDKRADARMKSVVLVLAVSGRQGARMEVV